MDMHQGIQRNPARLPGGQIARKPLRPRWADVARTSRKLRAWIRRRDLAAAFASLLFAAPAARATVFIFTADGFHQSQLVHATKLANKCADIHVRFRIGGIRNAGLSRSVSRMEKSGFRYYIMAGSSDYGLQHLFWKPHEICTYLKEPHAAGLYLHEVLSATIGHGRQFGEADWSLIGQYARCASQDKKVIVWSEFAGGNWGWSTFLKQISRRGSTARDVLTKYKKTFIFLWADNRDIRRLDQRSDMMLARKIVRSLGSSRNPLSYAFPHGVSLQDWLWFEMNRNKGGQIAPDAAKTLPPKLISQYGIDGFDHGARYFEFESYWNNPRMFTGIVQLRDHIIWARSCPQVPAP